MIKLQAAQPYILLPQPGRVCPHAKRAINISIRSGTLAITIVDMTEHIVTIQNPLAVTYEPTHLILSMLMYAMLTCYLCCISVRTCAVSAGEGWEG